MVFNRENLEKGNVPKFFNISDERATDLQAAGEPIFEQCVAENTPTLEFVARLTDLAKTQEEECYLLLIAGSYIGCNED